MVSLTSPQILGLIYLLVQKIWLGKCSLETQKGDLLPMKFYVSFFSFVTTIMLFTEFIDVV